MATIFSRKIFCNPMWCTEKVLHISNETRFFFWWTVSLSLMISVTFACVVKVEYGVKRKRCCLSLYVCLSLSLCGPLMTEVTHRGARRCSHLQTEGKKKRRMGRRERMRESDVFWAVLLDCWRLLAQGSFRKDANGTSTVNERHRECVSVMIATQPPWF